MNTLNHVRKLFNLFVLKIKLIGFGGALKFLFKKATGVLRCEREIETLNYIINHYVDITKFPPAKGEFRKMQLCDTVLLSVFDAVCKKYNWSYWLHAGTLLGAVRHKGFIPWDDDIDTAMPRKDYDELCERGQEIFSSYGDDDLFFTVTQDACRIFYNMNQTGVFLDVFPVDLVKSESDDETTNIKLLGEKTEKYHSLWSYRNKMTLEQLNEARNKIFGNPCDIRAEGLTAIFYPEFSFVYELYRYPHMLFSDVIFPLGTIEFEGYTFNAPNDPHKYLSEFFGDYMQFPKSGLEHHNVKLRAEESGINMDEVLEKLKDIERFFRA